MTSRVWQSTSGNRRQIWPLPIDSKFPPKCEHWPKEKSVEQARQAFDSFISAAHCAVSAFEGQAETACRGAKDVTENAMTFAQHNIASSFELAEQLVRARDVEEVLKLQADYIKRQMQLFSEQARELGERTSATAKDATTPNQG